MGFHKPIKSIIGVTDKHKCRRCKRLLTFEQFTSLHFIRSSKQNRSAHLLHPYCNKCREMLKGDWVNHPEYSLKADLFVGSMLSAAKSNAYQRGIPFLLKKDDILGMYVDQKGRCSMTGIKFALEEGLHIISDTRKPSLDRVNSSEGYYPGNVHLVCAIVNIMKNNLSYERFIRLCEKVVRHQADKEDELRKELC